MRGALRVLCVVRMQYYKLDCMPSLRLCMYSCVLSACMNAMFVRRMFDKRTGACEPHRRHPRNISGQEQAAKQAPRQIKLCTETLLRRRRRRSVSKTFGATVRTRAHLASPSPHAETLCLSNRNRIDLARCGRCCSPGRCCRLLLLGCLLATHDKPHHTHAAHMRIVQSERAQTQTERHSDDTSV